MISCRDVGISISRNGFCALAASGCWKPTWSTEEIARLVYLYTLHVVSSRNDERGTKSANNPSRQLIGQANSRKINHRLLCIFLKSHGCSKTRYRHSSLINQLFIFDQH